MCFFLSGKTLQHKKKAEREKCKYTFQELENYAHRQPLKLQTLLPGQSN